MPFWKRRRGSKLKPAAQEQRPVRKISQVEIDAACKQVLEILEPFKRRAWIPKTYSAEPEFSTQSKFGGYPYLRNIVDWPICPGCNKHMQLFLQLEMSTLPEKASGGLVQLFYCTSRETHCESDLEAWAQGSKAVSCRRIEYTGDSARIVPMIDGLFPEKRILDWEARDDFPHWEDYEKLGIRGKIDPKSRDIAVGEMVGIALDGDKLFGWPYWVQGPEWPIDRKTGAEMELLFQLDNLQGLPYDFGDAGIAHLCQSPDDPEEFGFGWSCL